MDLLASAKDIGSLIKLFNVIEERQKQQDAEITFLRKECAELRKENALITERLARVEESRHTVVAEMKTAVVEMSKEWEMHKLREELAVAKRKQITDD